MIADAVPEASIIKGESLRCGTLVLADYVQAIALLTLIVLVLIILSGVASVYHCGLKGGLDFLEPLADPCVGTHACGARLLQLFGLAPEGLTHLLA